MHSETDYQKQLEEIEQEADSAAAFLENDAVREFVTLHGTERGYDCAIFKMVKAPESSRMMLAHQITFSDAIPSGDKIVEEFGEGEYEWRIISTNAAAKAKLEGNKIIIVKKVFIGPRWARLHKVFTRDQEMKDRKERRDRQREELEELQLEALYLPGGGGGGDHAKLLELVKAMKPGAEESPVMALLMKSMVEQRPGFNWQGVAAVLAAASPVLAAVFQRVLAPPTQTVREPGPFDGLVTQLVNSVLEKKMLEISPPETENRSWVMDLVESLAGAIPIVVSTLNSIPKPMRGTVAGAAIKGYKGGPELFEAFRKDPEALAIAVNKWDAQLGWGNTDVILESVGMERPATTADNKTKFPKIVEPDKQPGGAGAPAAESAAK